MSYTKTIFIIYGVVAILIMGIFVYGIIDIRNKGVTASTLQNEADTASREEELAQSILYIKNKSKDDLANLDNFVLTEEKIVPFIELIESTGKSFGLDTTINSVSTDKDTKNPGLEKAHVIVETEGSWSSNANFLHALENLPTKVSIDSVKMDSGAKWHMSTSLSFTTFK